MEVLKFKQCFWIDAALVGAITVLGCGGNAPPAQPDRGVSIPGARVWSDKMVSSHIAVHVEISHDFPDASWKRLAEIEGLEGVEIQSISISNEQAQEIGTLKGLRTLSCSGCRASDGFFAALEKLSDLTSLFLVRMPVEDSAIVHVGRLKDLEMLVLNSTSVTGANFDVIMGLERLSNLQLSSSPISDAAMSYVARMPALKILAIDYTNVGDEGAKALGDSGTIKSLSFSGTKISDVGIKHISRMSQLEGLSLADTQVSDRGLLELKSLKNLTRLHLTRQEVVQSAVEELRKALPKLKVGFGECGTEQRAISGGP